MARIYYSRQYYNQLKKKQYEEYLKRLNEYYLYKKKYYEEYHEEYIKRKNAYYLYEKKQYEEYLKRQNAHYLYKRKYYQEYIKRRNMYYLYEKKYYEEYFKRQNSYYSYSKKYDEEQHKRNNDVFVNKEEYDKTYPSQSEFSNSFKASSVEDNNINEDGIKNNSHSSLEINIKEKNLEYKKHDSDKYDNLEEKNCTRVEDGYNAELLSCGPLEIDIKEKSLEYKKCDSAKCDKLESKNCMSIEDVYNEHFLGTKDEDKDQIDKCSIEICKRSVSPEKLPIRETISNTSDTSARSITVKIPVVLTECSVTLTVKSSLKLEDDVLEIKQVRKNAYLNQCKLIPNSENDKPNTGIVFLAGFIMSNIEYSTKEHNDKEILSGKLKNATINIPFKCTTRVTFKTPPKFKATTSQEQVEISQTSIKVCDHYEEEITGRDIKEQSFRSIEFFNEKVFCELISAEFVESDILENPTNKQCKSPIEQTFHDITENVVLFLTIKLLQNQDVIISK